MSAHLPHWSQVSEQSLLGALMANNAAWDEVGDLVSAADFFDARNGEVFAAITAQILANRPADAVTVLASLTALGKAEQCGGLVYLNALAQSVPSAAHARRYAELVHQHAKRRRVIAAADEAQTVAQEEADPGAAMDRIGALFDAVQFRATASESRSLGELVIERTGDYEALSRGEVAAGISTGMGPLDRGLGGGIKRSLLYVLGATPSTGKTALAAQLSRAVAAAGEGALIFSLEMPARDLTDRFVAAEAGVSMSRIATGQLAQDDWGRIAEAADHLNSLNLRIDDQPALTLQQLRARARQHKRRYGLALIVIDYLQLMAPADPKLTRHHQVEAISRGLKTLAKELDCAVLALSQLTRSSVDREPELSDLKESGAIGEDADVVMLLHPAGNEPDGSQVILLKLAKNRQGRRGRLALAFDARHQRFAPSSANVDRRTP